MDNTIKGFETKDGTALYDFSALANMPEVLKEVPAAQIGQYLVGEAVDESGKISKVKAVAAPEGGNGASVFYWDFSTGVSDDTLFFNVSDQDVSGVSTNGHSLQAGDLLITSDGVLLQVTEVVSDSTGDKFDAEMCAMLRGAQGNDYVLTDEDMAEIAELVENTGSDAHIIPDYWEAALDEGVEAINTALCQAGREKSAFLFYSDAHWNYGSQMSPALLKYLHHHTGMTRTFFGGDIVNDEASDYDAMEYLWDWREQLKDLPNHHSVPGNHDDGNSTNNLFSEQYVYGYLLAAEETPDLVCGDSGLYYYIDSPAERTRYLCLDTGYQDLNSLSAEQAQFIRDSLKSAPEGWHIVAIAHIWYVPDYTQSSVRPIPVTGLSAAAASVAAILDSYNSRSGEFADCGAKVAFCIGGHVHRDYTGTTDGGIPIVVVETDSRHIRSELTYTAGTTTEASVNGIIADYHNDILTVVRIGRGESFTVNLLTGEPADTPGSDPTPDTPDYTNVLDTVGYQTGYRLNSSGKATARDDRCITGFISAPTGSTVYFKNVGTQTSDYGCTVAHYTTNSEDGFLTGKSYILDTSKASATWWEDGSLKSYKVNEADVAWLRFGFVTIDETSVITVNEPIV